MVAKVKSKKVVKEEVVEQVVDTLVFVPANHLKKPWVNLTDDEIKRLNTTDNLGEINYARAIERALKAKNNG